LAALSGLQFSQSTAKGAAGREPRSERRRAFPADGPAQNSPRAGRASFSERQVTQSAWALVLYAGMAIVVVFVIFFGAAWLVNSAKKGNIRFKWSGRTRGER
jgi:hypothetical protein